MNKVKNEKLKLAIFAAVPNETAANVVLTIY
jgi:hypothetical protein